MLSKKLTKRLIWIQELTDNPSGMYRGDRWDMAKAQHEKLEQKGLIIREQPHNPSHFYPYAVITERGRKSLQESHNQ